MPRLRDDRGIALPLAIFALVVVGAMVAGAFFIGRQEQSVGRNSVKLQQAFAAAEGGAQALVANWNTDVYNQLTAGGSLDFGPASLGNGWYRGTLLRLNDQLFVVRSEGFDRDSTTRQQVGLLLRLRPIEIDISAALETQGNLRIGGSSDIDGDDSSPLGWLCPPLEPSLPGIRMPDTSLITTPGCANINDCVDGDPLVQEDPTITGTSLMTFGDATFDELRAIANKVVYPPPSTNMVIQPELTISGQCNKTLDSNWGSPLDPLGPCGTYFPVIWVEGDMNINGVQGQGILLVDGNLDVQGRFEFFGPVIVRGVLSTQGTGGHFNGGVIAANINLDQNTVLGDAVITYSSCALERALQASAQGDILRERSWVNMY
ncbi:MAG TPA: hypothetical protein VFH97_07270 [Gemmatimonadales bacterium]|nr:hypothetical protein [Gemmatimonadales bacterium]